MSYYESKTLTKYGRIVDRQKFWIVAIVIITACFSMFLFAYANSSSVSFESEDGVLAGGEVINDASASNGEAIAFSPVVDDEKLAWSPPTLVNPTTINLGTGNTTTNLDDDEDAIIKLPASTKVGYTTINGGRNVIIMGGHITIPESADSNSSDSVRRAIYIKDNNGIVHIEGVLIDASGGGESDGIAISSPNSIVQIQNTRIVGLKGRKSAEGSSPGMHADIVQPWGGVKELRIDRLTGSSAYQGLQLTDDLGPIEKADIRNVNMTALPAATSTSGGGYMMWFGSCGKVYDITLSDVYIQPRDGRSIAKSVWPDSDDATCPAQVISGRASWPSLPQVKGFVGDGQPAAGDFVPSGVAGLNYSSPGY